MKIFFLFCVLLIIGNTDGVCQNYNIILGRPTDVSITISILFDQQVDFYVEYGIASGAYTATTSQVTSVNNTPDKIDLTGLSPNTKYYYRVQYRPAGTGSFLASSEYTFRTQRPSGSTYTFTVESDVHLYDKKGCDNLYAICLQNEAAENPDFMINMGDTYGDDHHPDTIGTVYLNYLHKYYRPILGKICHSVPYFFCVGNHEGEMNYYLNQNPPNNMAVLGTLWRKFYYPNPFPNNFYTGNTEIEPYGIGNPENYYAWTWGDALFVVLDVYRYQSISDTTAKPQKWDWTLGQTQYTWLKNTLENSTATYKFIFAHQIRGQGRGGVEDAPYYEWGGLDGNGNNLFASKRPGWAKPIHQLFVDNGVNIFFHGHDHLFAHEVLDGVNYQELPMPSDSTYQIGMLANANAYVSDTLNGSGFLRVNVSPSCVQVDYVRAYLPADTLTGLHHNREVAFSYSIGTCTSTMIENHSLPAPVIVYPNPGINSLNVIFPDEVDEMNNLQITLIDVYGQTVLSTNTPRLNLQNIKNGIYFLTIKYDEGSYSQKVIISH